ncbi:MAG: DedA family protein [Bacteroidota bacterium]
MEHIVCLLLKYKYAILFPFAIFEGPIVTVLAGFLSSMGTINPFLALLIIVPGDITGDTLYYFLGRFGRTGWLHRISNKLGLTDKKLERAEAYFSSNPHKAIPLSKVILGVGVAGLFLAGRSGFPYYRFIAICAITSAVQCSIYMCLGYFFGYAYLQINEALNYVAATSIVIAVLLALFFIIRSKLKTKIK